MQPQTQQPPAVQPVPSPAPPPAALHPAGDHYIRHDLISRLEHRRRTRELLEFAAEERIPLPMPATWIATLESLGYVVDLITGAWTAPVQYWPVSKAPPALGADGVQ